MLGKVHTANQPKTQSLWVIPHLVPDSQCFQDLCHCGTFFNFSLSHTASLLIERLWHIHEEILSKNWLVSSFHHVSLDASAGIYITESEAALLNG